MLIAEELLLVALHPVKGTVPLAARSYLRVGLSGALLAELAIAGELQIHNGRVTRSDGVPDDPFLAEVQAAFDAATKPEKAKSAVGKLDKRVGGVWRRLVERMVATGALGEQKRGPFMPTRHPVLDVPLHDSVLTRLHAAASGEGPIEPRLAVLLALTGPCRLLERVAPERSTRRHAKFRIKEATAQAPFAPEVRKIIDELVAATAAVVVTTSSS